MRIKFIVIIKISLVFGFALNIVDNAESQSVTKQATFYLTTHGYADSAGSKMGIIQGESQFQRASFRISGLPVVVAKVPIVFTFQVSRDTSVYTDYAPIPKFSPSMAGAMGNTGTSAEAKVFNTSYSLSGRGGTIGETGVNYNGSYQLTVMAKNGDVIPVTCGAYGSAFSNGTGVAHVDVTATLVNVTGPPDYPGLRIAQDRVSLAQQILNHKNIELADRHVSPVNDNATVSKEINDTAEGKAATRSSYGNAPGGTVNLSPTMLEGMLRLADIYEIDVSEVAGGSHSVNSSHYAGDTFDINYVNGEHVSPDNPYVAEFVQLATELGATQIFHPYNEPLHHSNHLHIRW